MAGFKVITEGKDPLSCGQFGLQTFGFKSWTAKRLLLFPQHVHVLSQPGDAIFHQKVVDAENWHLGAQTNRQFRKSVLSQFEILS